jgi:hypothetical protein
MKGEHISNAPIETYLYPRNCAEKIPFVSRECTFTPCGWATIDDIPYPLGYKIVTEDQKSLGLRKNPNIMTFPTGVWVILPNKNITVDKDDWGGIWTALRRGSIKTLKYYMLEEKGVITRAFLTAMYRPVFANSYRIKSQGVMLLSEIL